MTFTDLMESIRGWGRFVTYDGIRLVSPVKDQGAIAIHQRVPLRPVVEMVRAHARTVWGAAGEPELGEAHLFATLEGEHACQMSVRVKTSAGLENHSVAFVIGDDHAVVIDGVAAVDRLPSMRTRVHDLAESYFLALGEIRRRRFWYQPPPGWNGLRRATSTWWYHPEYPRHLSVIKIFDARPAAVNAPDVLDRILFVDPSIVSTEPPPPPIPCQGPSGLVGQIVSGTGMLNGVPMSFAAAYVTDERFGYLMRLEVHKNFFDEDVKVLAKLADGIAPVPRNVVQSSTSNLIHWIE